MKQDIDYPDIWHANENSTCRPRLCRTCTAVSWQIGYYDLLCLWVKTVVYAQASRRITCIPTIFDMPVGRKPAAVPVELIGVCTTGGVLNAIQDRQVIDRPRPPVHTLISALRSQPQQASRCGLNIYEFWIPSSTVSVRCQCKPAC